VDHIWSVEGSLRLVIFLFESVQVISSILWPGDVIRIHVLGRPIIILNSRRAIASLLNERSVIYSDRPSMTVLSQWAGWTWSLPGLPYGSTMMTHRRLFAFSLNQQASRGFHSIMENGARGLAMSLIHDPSQLDLAVHTYVTCPLHICKSDMTQNGCWYHIQGYVRL
jgi:hypothetical protein